MAKHFPVNPSLGCNQWFARKGASCLVWAVISENSIHRIIGLLLREAVNLRSLLSKGSTVAGILTPVIGISSIIT